MTAAPHNFGAYDRLVIGFHGTRRRTVRRLLRGKLFDPSENSDDWLGHGIYFWEHAPQQAWWWAERRYGNDAAVVGAVLRLGRCLDLLDPQNMTLLHAQYKRVVADLRTELPKNFNTHKHLDCLVFNQLYHDLGSENYMIDCTRAVFVPMTGGKLNRPWERSGIFEGAHIQLCVREPRNIIGVWSIKRDGSYGEEKSKK